MPNFNQDDPTLSARLQEFIAGLDHADDTFWVEGEVKLSVLAPKFGPLTRAQVQASGAIRRIEPLTDQSSDPEPAAANGEPVAEAATKPLSVIEQAELAVVETELAMRLAIKKTIETLARTRKSREALAVAVCNWSAAFPIVTHRENLDRHLKSLAKHKADGMVSHAESTAGRSPLDQHAAYTKPGSGGRANDPSSYRRGGSVHRGTRLPSSRG
jgi:hypothetical protein